MVKRRNNKQTGFTPIRITKNDIQEYRRLERNTKAKIKRTIKNYGIDLSNEIELPPIESFKTRKDFNEWKDKVKIFTNRANRKYQFKKNKFGVVKSVKEIDELKKATKQAQKVAKKIQQENAEKPFISGGKQYGTVGQRQQLMDRPNVGGIYVPPDFDFEKIATNKQFEDKRVNLEERGKEDFFDKRKQQFKENYIKAINENFNSHGDPIVEKVKDIHPDDLFDMFLMFDELEINFYYTEEDYENHVERVLSIFERYETGNINFDLRGF